MSHQRIRSIDITKGIATILMVISHTIQFSNIHTPVTDLMKLTGDTFSLTIFISLIGFINVKSVLLKPLNISFFKKMIYRFLVYWSAFGCIIFFEHRPFFSLHFALNETVRHMSFQNFGSYAEFFYLFLYFTLFFVVIRLFLGNKKLPIYVHITIWMCIGIGAFYLSQYLGNIFEFEPQSNRAMASLISGCYNCLTFPILQYMLPVSIGVIYGMLYFHTQNEKKFSFMSFGVSFLCILFILIKYNFHFVIPAVQRWPPSLAFLSLGSCVFILLLSFFSVISKPSAVLSYFSFIGSKSLLITVVHLVILDILILSRIPYSSSPLTIFMTFFVLIHGFLIVLTVQKLAKKLYTGFLSHK